MNTITKITTAAVLVAMSTASSAGYSTSTITPNAFNGGATIQTYDYDTNSFSTTTVTPNTFGGGVTANTYDYGNNTYSNSTVTPNGFGGATANTYTY